MKKIRYSVIQDAPILEPKLIFESIDKLMKKIRYKHERIQFHMEVGPVMVVFQEDAVQWKIVSFHCKTLQLLQL